MTAFVQNSNVLELQGLKDAITNAYINDATVTVTIVNAATGATVAGQSWPMTMTYVPASSGNYRAILADTISFTAKTKYKAKITANAGVGRVGYWEFEIRPLVRTGVAPNN